MCEVHSSASQRTVQGGVVGEPSTSPTCPRDGTALDWVRSLSLLLCPVCGWYVYLTAAQAADLDDALRGLLPDLRLNLFIARLPGSRAARR